MTKTLITLCTYNERENIAMLIPELHTVAPAATILIIDDNSPDGTGLLADQLCVGELTSPGAASRRQNGPRYRDARRLSLRNRKSV